MPDEPRWRRMVVTDSEVRVEDVHNDGGITGQEVRGMEERMLPVRTRIEDIRLGLGNPNTIMAYDEADTILTQSERRGEMKSYLFSDISTEGQEKLKDNDIPICDFEGGILIESDYLTKVLDVLDLTLEGEAASGYDGIVRPVFSDEEVATTKSGKFKVKHQLLPNEERIPMDIKKKFFDCVRDILLPLVNKDVTFSIPHAHPVALPPTDEKFHILMWSCPEGQSTSRAYPPSEMWGRYVECQSTSFSQSSGRGIPIIDEASGWHVAELFDNALYIHHDICHYGRESEVELFRELCNRVAIEMVATPEEKEARRKVVEIERAKNSRLNYIKACSKRIEASKKSAEASIVDRKDTIRNYQEAITLKVRELQEDTVKLVALGNLGDQKKRYETEYDKLLAMPKVLRVEAFDTTMNIYTDILYCEHDKKTYEIGAFRIEIYINDGYVRWHNQTRQIPQDEIGQAMNAPHVDRNGEACYGNTGQIWPQLIGNYEFAAVAMVAIQFVESVNAEDDWGKYIKDWPTVTKKELKAIAKVKTEEKVMVEGEPYKPEEAKEYTVVAPSTEEGDHV